MIVHARTTGVSFCQLDESETKLLLDNIMLRGAAICGCALPTTEFFADIIADEISTLLEDFGFRELTESEILLALRLNGKGSIRYPSGTEIDTVAFSGNCINTAFLSKVLTIYMTFRGILERRIQNFIDGY